MRLSTRYAITFAVSFLSSWPVIVSAQFALRSKIEGTVTDSTGASVPGATVTLTETTRNQVHVATLGWPRFLRLLEPGLRSSIPSAPSSRGS